MWELAFKVALILIAAYFALMVCVGIFAAAVNIYAEERETCLALVIALTFYITVGAAAISLVVYFAPN